MPHLLSILLTMSMYKLQGIQLSPAENHCIDSSTIQDAYLISLIYPFITFFPFMFIKSSPTLYSMV